MGNIVVITGANRGLGLELVRAYAARGDMVIGCCRRPEKATELAKLTPHSHALDVGDPASIEAFVASIGDRAVDVLINNAGIDARHLGAPADERGVLQLSADHFVGEMRVNAVGPMLVARALVPNLLRSALPRIVNVSSQSGSMVVARRMGRDVGYSASKAALNMVTVSLARCLHDEGAVVIALHPGYVKTDMAGFDAPMHASTSASSIAALVDRLTIDDSGMFFRWDGSLHPW